MRKIRFLLSDELVSRSVFALLITLTNVTFLLAQTDVYRSSPYGNTHDNAASAMLETQMHGNAELMKILLAKKMLEEQAKRSQILNGQQKIQKGLATTRFKPSSSSPFLTEAAAQLSNSPQKAMLLQVVANFIEQFKARAVELGLTQNDQADGFALAFALSYEAWRNQKVSVLQLQKLREGFRQQFLTSAEFQGMPDAAKHQEYDFLAFKAMRAFTLASNKDVGGATFEENQRHAKSDAETVLKRLYRGPLENINSMLTGYEYEDAGAAKIRAGKATRRIVLTDAGFAYVVNHLTFEPSEPTTKPAQIEYTKNQVKRFEERMSNAGFVPGDSADVETFAYVLASEAYHDVKLNAAEVEQLKEKNRREFLTMPLFQGSPELQKQDTYILQAIMSVQAIEAREKARQAQDAAEREEAAEKARGYANAILKIN